MHLDQSNGAVIVRVFTQIDSDVLTEPQAFVLSPVKFAIEKESNGHQLGIMHNLSDLLR
jgi:hypothetical protein